MTKPKPYKIGSTVVPRHFINGYPVGIGQEAWCEVQEVRKHGLSHRYRIVSSRNTSYWVNHEDIRQLGKD